MTRKVSAPSNMGLSCSASRTAFWCCDAIVNKSTTLNLTAKHKNAFNWKGACLIFSFQYRMYYLANEGHDTNVYDPCWTKKNQIVKTMGGKAERAVEVWGSI